MKTVKFDSVIFKKEDFIRASISDRTVTLVLTGPIDYKNGEWTMMNNVYKMTFSSTMDLSKIHEMFENLFVQLNQNE